MAVATTIHCDFAGGDDTVGDGTLGNPYKTMQKAHDVVKARGGAPGQGDNTTIYLKNGAAYEEDVEVEEETTAANDEPLVIEGYSDTPGDGGVATFDGTDTRALGFALESGGDSNTYHWVLRNIEFKRYTDTAFEGVGAASFINTVMFQHCRFGNNVIGVEAGGLHSFLDCYFHDNTTGINGTNWDRGNVLRCIFEDNTNGMEMGKPNSGAIWNSLFIGNVNYSISTNNGVPIVNCVIDGKGKVGLLGVRYPDATGAIPRILNTIITDCVAGVQGVVAGAEELSAIFNCCFFANTSDFTQGAAKRTGCIFVDPQFVDKDNKDYGIKVTSPCKNAGLDLKSYDYYTSTAGKVDIGILQESQSSSGGLKIGAPLGFSVER